MGNASAHGGGNLDESEALSSLKELVAAGNHRLDPILETITDVAQQLTRASGAALAMWKDGAMVCRARSGETAPVLGARLSAETGISGECLRTGKIQHCVDSENDPVVDVEVCRRLGLRSIVVLPIQGWRGINGILEVFSTRPAAFGEAHIALLQQLATLAERARASQPYDASPSTSKALSAVGETRPSGLLPASDRLGDVALAVVGRRSRPLVLGAIGLAAIALLGLVIWLGWRTPDDAEARPRAAAQVAAGGAAGGNIVTARSSDKNSLAANPPNSNSSGTHSSDARSPVHPPDNDPVWKANPGGETLFSSNGKPSAGAPVKFVSKVEVIAPNATAPKKIGSDRTPLLADAAGKVVADPVITHSASSSEIGPANTAHADPRPVSSHADESSAVEPPKIAAGAANSSSLNSVLAAKASLPRLSAPVSTGVSGGELLHRVAPVYPGQALLLRQQGTVVVAATIMEDGSVRDVKAVAGPPVLAPSAVEAVKHWRYKPYVLDGKPVKSEIRVNVDFKFPDAASR